MRRATRWLLLLGLPLLTALLFTLLDTAAIRLLQAPMLSKQRARLENLEQNLASHDLTRLDEPYILALQSERMQTEKEFSDWQQKNSLLLRLDRIQLLPSIAFWVMYFILWNRLRRKQT